MKEEHAAKAVAIGAGYTPGARDVPRLVATLATCDESAREAIERALSRVTSAAPLLAALDENRDLARVTIVRALGRAHLVAARAHLVALVSDDEPRVRKAAVRALGKFDYDDELERVLIDRLASEPRIEVRRAIVESLGKVGGAASLSLIAKVADVAKTGSDDAELARLTTRARLLLERRLARTQTSSLDLERPLAPPERASNVAHPARAADVRHVAASTLGTRALLWTRRGLEPFVCEELAGPLAPRIIGQGCVEVTLRGAPLALLASRVATSFGFPLMPEVRSRERSIEACVVAAMTSLEARAILDTWTRGPKRFRIDWSGGGHKRSAVWAIAEAIRRIDPELVNDSRDATWEARVTTLRNSVEVVLIPNGAGDARFAYRKKDIPAASHPTLAAALARLAGAYDDDVVWDPFVGSGLELIERARLGSYARLIGSDLDQGALDAARENLVAAGLDATLTIADARTHRIDDVSLIITNPPYGRRVTRDKGLQTMLDQFVAHAARSLRPAGRLAWNAPFPERAREVALRAGLLLVRAQMVDMGGFDVEIQLFRK